MNDSQLSLGFLVVNAVTADGLIPIENALITVSISDGEDTYVYRVARTDTSGKTPRIPIPTPNISASLTPGDTIPYTTVIIEGDKEGYYTSQYINAPVFPAVVTLQQVNFIPIDERARVGENSTVYYENEESDL